MQTHDLIPLRLANQHLIDPVATSIAEVVGWLGAVQSQDVAGAKWAIGQRTLGATDAVVDEAYNRGDILRTHILRPTWHFVLPQDIRWLQLATAHRVHAIMAYQKRQLDISDVEIGRYMHVIEAELSGGNALTRQRLFDAFAMAEMPATGLRGAFVVMHAELTCLIASGPLKGKQHTYMLLDDRAPNRGLLSQEEALARLAVRYFQSHGPGTHRDLAWWSSLTLREAQTAIDLAGNALESVQIEGITWWSGQQQTPVVPYAEPMVRLLPNYDEYFSRHGKTERHDGPEGGRAAELLAAGRFDKHHLIINGRLRGGWRRNISSKGLLVTVDPFDHYADQERMAVEHEVQRYGEFLALQAESSWLSE